MHQMAMPWSDGDAAHVGPFAEYGVAETWALTYSVLRNHDDVRVRRAQAFGDVRFLFYFANNLNIGLVPKCGQDQLAQQTRAVRD